MISVWTVCMRVCIYIDTRIDGTYLNRHELAHLRFEHRSVSFQTSHQALRDNCLQLQRAQLALMDMASCRRRWPLLLALAQLLVVCGGLGATVEHTFDVRK